MVVQSFSQSCDGEGLAGGSSDENIDICLLIPINFRHVTKVRNVRVVVG